MDPLTHRAPDHKPRLESFETPAVSFWGGGGGGHSFMTRFVLRRLLPPSTGKHHQPRPLHMDTISSFLCWMSGAVQALESEVQDVNDFLQLVISSTCRPTLGSREFITNQPPRPISRGARHRPPTPTKTHPAQTACIL